MPRSLALLPLVIGAAAAQALSISVLDQRAETCGNANGSIAVTGFGGQAPYSYDWTGPNGFVANGPELTGLVGGDYVVTVTDALAATANRTITIDSMTELPYGGGPTWAGAAEVTGYWGGACLGQCNGAGAFVDGYSGGTPPFSYFFDVPATYLGYNSSVGGPVYGGFCHGENVEYSYTDALGCSGLGGFLVFGVDGTWMPVVLEVQGACTDAENGSMSLELTGGFPQAITLWSNGQVVATQAGQFGTVTFSNLAAGVYTVIADFEGTQCSLQQDVTVQDLGMDCGTVIGTSWYDVNGDCIHDPGEVGIPGSILSVEPGGHLILTHGDGDFLLALPSGEYTLSQTDPTLVPICPSPPVAFTIGTAPVALDLANGSTQELDLRVWANSSAARPGFDHFLYARATNLSPQPSGPVTLTVIYDPALIYLNATPAPTSVVGNILTWEWPAFGSFEDQLVNAQFTLPPGVPLGTVLNSSFTATNTLPEVDLTNNTVVEDRAVTGSYDPNDKTARTSSRSSEQFYFIGNDEYIDYTIRFQNTGTDTAFTVVITDTLSADYDMSSFQASVCSHPCTVDFKVGRVVEWTFADILLPDSNVNEAASHGLASFRIKLNEPVLAGTVVENTANIYFDFNEPVITEPSVLVAEFSTGIADIALPTLQLSPNPATDQIILRGISDGSLSSIHVLAIDGRFIKAPMRRAGSAVELNIRSFAPGTYLIRTPEGQARFVKQ